MAETAQPLAAESDANAQLAAAADAFKANATPIEPQAAPQPRDAQGRFANGEADPNEIPDPDADFSDAWAGMDDAAEADDAEAPDEGQPDAPELPASWSKDDAGLWASLPPDARAKIAAREGQRDQAVNAKFQELANQRRAAEGELAQANAHRDQHLNAIEWVLSLVAPVKPNPAEYGLGTPNYNRDAYDLALYHYEQQAAQLSDLTQQREHLLAQQHHQAARAEAMAYDAIEQQARPRLLQAVPELNDAHRAPQALGEIVRFAVDQGIPEQLFADPEQAKRITSAELLLAWKAMQYDRLQAAKGRVQPRTTPRPAAPAIRPGVTTPRSATERASRNAAFDRLNRSGSVEDAAAFFKPFAKG